MCYRCDEADSFFNERQRQEAREFVLAGATMLDSLEELKGTDWRQVVRDNADRLDLWSCANCVLGILFDSKADETYEETFEFYDTYLDELCEEIREATYESGYNWFVMNYPDADPIELGFCPDGGNAAMLRETWLEYLGITAS